MPSPKLALRRLCLSPRARVQRHAAKRNCCMAGVFPSILRSQYLWQNARPRTAVLAAMTHGQRLPQLRIDLVN